MVEDKRYYGVEIKSKQELKVCPTLWIDNVKYGWFQTNLYCFLI